MRSTLASELQPGPASGVDAKARRCRMMRPRRFVQRSLRLSLAKRCTEPVRQAPLYLSKPPTLASGYA